MQRNFISVKDGPEKKDIKQSRDERMQEDYSTSAKIHSRCRVVFCWYYFVFGIISATQLQIQYHTVQMNAFITSDKTVLEHQPHTHTHSSLPATSKQTVGRDVCYSQVLTFENGWYHTLVLTSGYAIYPQVICMKQCSVLD